MDSYVEAARQLWINLHDELPELEQLADAADADDFLRTLRQHAQALCQARHTSAGTEYAAKVYTVVSTDAGVVTGVFGPFDENEAGAVCAAAISKGARPGSLQVWELGSLGSPSATFHVV